MDASTLMNTAPYAALLRLVRDDVDAAGYEDGCIPHVNGFEIAEQIGEGGMGSIWKALQLSTKRPVALKFLKATGPISPKDRGRFEREVETAAQLDHSGVVKVYESGVQRGVYFYAMELIEGQHLDEYVSHQGLSGRDVVTLVKQIADALDHAHRRGVIHRDLKPSNIIVRGDGRPCIVDFGLAKALERDDHLLTRDEDGEAPGTLGFMSPEQASGDHKAVDTRSDVYALGAILYLLLIGSTPHTLTGTRFSIRRAIIEEEIVRPRKAKPDLDRELEAILLKALARDPGARYASAGELSEDLQRYLNGDPLVARPATLDYVLRRWLQRHARRIAVFGVTLAVAATCAAWGIHELQIRIAGVRQDEYIRQIQYVERDLVANDLAGAAQTLRLCELRERGFEWALLSSLLDNSELSIPSSEVRAAAVDNERGVLIGVSFDGAIREWDLTSGREERLERIEGFVSGMPIALSPNGHIVAFVTESELIALHRRDHRQVRVSIDTVGAITSLCVAANGSVAIADRKNDRVQVLAPDLTTRVLDVAAPFGASVLALNARCTQVAVGGAGVGVYSVNGAGPLHSEKVSALVTGLSFNESGTRLMVGRDDGLVTVWETGNWSKSPEFSPYGNHAISAVAFTRGNDDLLIGCRDGRLGRWPADASTPGTLYRGETSEILAAMVADRSNRVVASTAQGVRVWSVTPNEVGAADLGGDDSDAITCAAISGNNEVVVGTTSGWVGTVDLRSRRATTLAQTGALITAVSSANDGSVIAWADAEGRVTLLTAGKDPLALKPRIVDQINTVSLLALHPGGDYLVVSYANTSNIYDTASGKLVGKPPPGQWIAWEEQDSGFWTAASQQDDRMTISHVRGRDWVVDAEHLLSPDLGVLVPLQHAVGRLMLRDKEGRLHLYNPATHVVEVSTPAGAAFAPLCSALHPSEERFVMAGTGLQIASRSTGQLIIDTKTLADQLYRWIDFTTDGKFVVTLGIDTTAARAQPSIKLRIWPTVSTGHDDLGLPR